MNHDMMEDMMEGRTAEVKNQKEIQERNNKTDGALPSSVSDCSFWMRTFQSLNPAKLNVKLTKITEQTLPQHGGDPAQLRELLEASARSPSRTPPSRTLVRTSIKTPSKSPGRSSAKTPVRSPTMKVKSPKTFKLRSNRKKKSSSYLVSAEAAEKKEELRPDPGHILTRSISQSLPQQLSPTEAPAAIEVDEKEEKTDCSPGTSGRGVPQQTNPAPTIINRFLQDEKLSYVENLEKDSSTETILFISNDSPEQDEVSPAPEVDQPVDQPVDLPVEHPVDHRSVSVCDNSLLKSPQSSRRDSMARER